MDSSVKSSSPREDELEEEVWVLGSSVDHRGRPPLRAATGSWKAAMFIIVIEFSERLSYFGLATSLIIYLTKVLQQNVKTAAKNANYWQGVTTLTPLLGGFVADAYLGRFSTVLLSSLVYLAGLVLLSMSQLVPNLRPCAGSGGEGGLWCHRPSRLHETVFFVAVYLVSVGTGGHKPALESFGADQFDEGHAAERRQKMSFFNWWNCGLCSGLLLGVTAVVYVQDRVGWGTADVVLTAVMAFALLVFLAGKRSYRYRVPAGSPLTPMMRVAVAAARKRRLRPPADTSELYEVETSNPQKIKKALLCHTNKLRFLDKAAIVVEGEAGEAPRNPWRLSTVTEVEETKLVLSMVPIWVSALPFGVCVAQVSTFFVKQAAAMDRRLSPRFEVPPASIYGVAALGMIAAVAAYDKALEPALRRATGRERGVSILQRIGVGMALSAVAMAVAAAIERRRLSSPRPESVPVLWLAPQFTLMGFADGFALVGLQEYFYDQAPDGMRGLGIGAYLSVIGAGSFLSSLLITAADRASARGGRRPSWFAGDLDRSRLDLFYWLLACISAANLCWYAFVATRYSYKSVKSRVGDGDENEREASSGDLDHPAC